MVRLTFQRLAHMAVVCLFVCLFVCFKKDLHISLVLFVKVFYPQRNTLADLEI
jgi:hypothetical protein